MNKACCEKNTKNNINNNNRDNTNSLCEEISALVSETLVTAGSTFREDKKDAYRRAKFYDSKQRTRHAALRLSEDFFVQFSFVLFVRKPAVPQYSLQFCFCQIIPVHIPYTIPIILLCCFHTHHLTAKFLQKSEALPFIL